MNAFIFLVYTALTVLFLPSKSVDAKNASHGVVDENVTVLHLLTLLPRGDVSDSLIFYWLQNLQWTRSTQGMTSYPGTDWR